MHIKDLVEIALKEVRRIYLLNIDSKGHQMTEYLQDLIHLRREK